MHICVWNCYWLGFWDFESHAFLLPLPFLNFLLLFHHSQLCFRSSCASSHPMSPSSCKFFFPFLSLTLVSLQITYFTCSPLSGNTNVACVRHIGCHGGTHCWHQIEFDLDFSFCFYISLKFTSWLCEWMVIVNSKNWHKKMRGYSEGWTWTNSHFKKCEFLCLTVGLSMGLNFLYLWLFCFMLYCPCSCCENGIYFAVVFLMEYFLYFSYALEFYNFNASYR